MGRVRSASTGFTFQTEALPIRGVVLGSGLALLAWPLAAWFEEPRLEAIVYWLAFGAFIQGFWNIATVDFRKRLEMGKDFRFFLIPKLGSFVIGIALAFAWRSYWALVVAIVARRVIQLALGYAMRPYRPRPSLKHWRELVGFSKWLLVNNVLTFVRDQIDVLVVGKLAGPRLLGLYSVAAEIANLPITELALPIGRAIYPGFAKFAADT
jgi:lipopolysaccharide exporter